MLLEQSLYTLHHLFGNSSACTIKSNTNSLFGSLTAGFLTNVAEVTDNSLTKLFQN